MKARNFRILGIAPIVILVCIFSFPAHAKYGGGSGTALDPYQIATAEDLILLGESLEDYDKHFILTADIDLDPNLPSRKVFDKAVIAPDMNDVEQYFQGIPFTGVFDGNGHIIANLTMRGEDNLGLFGRVDYGAEIKNLGMVDVDIISSGDDIGGLMGFNFGESVNNCYSTGRVSGDKYVGGLVGYNGHSSRLTCSYAACTVTGDESVGGLIGDNDGILAHCYAMGNVEGKTNTGGLVGINDCGRITRCYSTASVSGIADVGGLVGAEGGCWTCRVTFSFWDIETSGQEASSGGTGKNTAQMQDPNTFIEAGWDFIDKPGGPSNIWAESTGGGYPILWWQFSPTLPLPTFSGGTGEPDDPYLISKAADLNSIGHNPRLMGAHFKLMNDIDLEGVNFYIISTEAFPYTGVFDGNGFIVSNFSYSSTDTHYVGLFRYVDDPNAEIKNLGLSNPNVGGGARDFIGSMVGYLVYRGKITGCYVNGGSMAGGGYVGGLVGGSLDSTITNCYSSAAVSGEVAVGGLVGGDERGAITGCYSSDVVCSGDSGIGGLVGYIKDSVVSNCYVEGGDVSGNYYVGGLVGDNSSGNITDCYSTSSVSGGFLVGGLVGGGGEVSGSFWDIQTSGQETSAGGIGKTTVEMQTASTFLDAGWDFVDETANGTEDIWWIDEGQDYPRLWWEPLND